MSQYDYILEQAILAAALDAGEVADVEASDFTDETHSLLWPLIQDYKEKHGAIDHVLFGEHLLRGHGIDQRDWLKAIASSHTKDADLLGGYAQALKARRDQTQLTETLSELTAKARETDAPAELHEEALQKLKALSVRKRAEVISVRDALKNSIEELDRLFTQSEMPGIKTGLPKLDEKMGGWQRSDLTLIAARPAVGKTALMCNLALSAECKIGIVSTEQPAVQIINRLIAIKGHVPAWKFRAPRALSDDEWPQITGAAQEIRDLPITIMDSTRPTIGDIESTFHNRQIDLLFVDYAQRIQAPGEIYERISAVAKGLKDLARNFDIPVVALAQINRAGAKNAGMEHLKGSGDLEQEADEVLILERGESQNTAVLTVEKNRHGPTGSIDLVFNAPYLQFHEATQDLQADY